MTKLTVVPAALLAALALAACGGDDDGGEPSEQPAATTTAPAPAPTPTAESGGAAAAPGEEELRETLIEWYARKDCDLMTDRFLEASVPGGSGSRAQLCAEWKKNQLTFDPETIRVTKVQIDGETGRAEAEREGTSESPAYELVMEGGEWKVNGNCRTRPGCMEALAAG